MEHSHCPNGQKENQETTTTTSARNFWLATHHHPQHGWIGRRHERVTHSSSEQTLFGVRHGLEEGTHGRVGESSRARGISLHRHGLSTPPLQRKWRRRRMVDGGARTGHCPGGFLFANQVHAGGRPRPQQHPVRSGILLRGTSTNLPGRELEKFENRLLGRPGHALTTEQHERHSHGMARHGNLCRRRYGETSRHVQCQLPAIHHSLQGGPHQTQRAAKSFSRRNPV
mmetsp:Transcript_13866/g.38341  ORF Transcript_13866/g.38341 Transcript_13866/m.38341 type:complete len:227 (-) Transcript_13866:372-1052(-)